MTGAISIVHAAVVRGNSCHRSTRYSRLARAPPGLYRWSKATGVAHAARTSTCDARTRGKAMVHFAENRAEVFQRTVFNALRSRATRSVHFEHSHCVYVSVGACV